MTLNFLLTFSGTVRKLIEVFGAPEGFEKEFKDRILGAEAVIQEELGKTFGEISSRVGFGEKGVAAIKEVKKWVAENYKFPQQ